MKLRIGIDTLGTVPYKQGGGKVFLLSILEGLKKIGRDDDFFLFVSRENAPLFERFRGENFHLVNCGLPNLKYLDNTYKKTLWEQTLLPFQIRKLKLDMVVFPANVMPFFSRGYRSAVVVHDSITFFSCREFPGFFSPLKKNLFHHLFKASIRHASLVLTVSKAIKAELVKQARIPQEKISVIFESAQPIDFSPQEEAELAAKYGALIKQGFIFFCGVQYKHKNIHNLVRGFSLFRKQSHSTVKLVLIGDSEGGSAEILKSIKDSDFSGDIMNLGHLGLREAVWLMKKAAVFVFPSLYEGFGLPVAEALSCGTPIIASRLPAVLEIAGEAAVYFDPLRPEDIAEKISMVMGDEKLIRELKEKSLKRSGELPSWEDVAENMLKAIREKVAEEQNNLNPKF